MRIGMMADNYQNHVSGVTNHISLCKKWLENAGHQVFVFTFGQQDNVDEHNGIIQTRGVPIADFYMNLQYSQQAKQLLCSMDLVHVHHPFASGMLARRYCTPNNIPIVFTNHTRYDLYSQAYLPILPKSISEAGLKTYLSQFYRACNLVIIPVESLQRVLIDNFGLDTPAVVIPNGVDLEPLSRVTNPGDRMKLGFSSEQIIAIYVGRLAPEKNLSFLLDAFGKVASRDSRMQLLMVGDGPERRVLENQARLLKIESKVHFTGLIPYDEVPRHLRLADIFVTPSLTEVLPLSTIEAIGAGLPVVGIDAPGTSDIVIDGVNGFLTRNEISSFCEKLAHLSSDDTLRMKLGIQAVETSKRYDIRNTTRTLIQYYSRLGEPITQPTNVVQ